MTSNHCIDTLRIIRTKRIGVKRFWEIQKELGDPESGVNFLKSKNFEVPGREEIEKLIEKNQKKGVEILCHCSNEFPTLLKETPNFPPILFYKGNLGLLKKNIIAIVGARNASISGIKIAQRMAEELSKFDCAIVSGFARGIDTAAHKASIDSGTIGVFANGLDIIYPPENIKLYDEIVEKGLIISEVECGVEPTQYSFPVRNRILAGLSKGVVIIEASYNSGTLITANCALDFGREVMVVPGSPLDSRYKGSHKLIKDGAMLVENALDVVSNLDLSQDIEIQEEIVSEMPKGDVQKMIYSFLSHDGIEVDEICTSIERSLSEINKALTELELDGKVKRDKNGMIYKI